MRFYLSLSEEADPLEIGNETAEQTHISDISDHHRSEDMSASDAAKEPTPKVSKTMNWNGTQNLASTLHR